MPSVAFKSRIKTVTEACTLTMVVQHRLLVGMPSDTLLTLKHSPPKELAVFLASNLFFTISGSLNAVDISSKEIKDSHITRHLVEYLRVNAGELGINAVPSGGYISDDTGLLTFAYTGCRPPSDVKPRANLVGFDITYAWQTKNVPPPGDLPKGHLDTEINPFSPNLTLPYLAVLNNSVERLITFQLVKRYPLIFGHWSKQLDIETTFFPSIFSSIQRIMGRSAHPDFVYTCKNLLTLCERRMENSTSMLFSAISTWTGTLDALDYPTYVSSPTSAFICAMHQMYRLGMKQSQFKGYSAICNFLDKDDTLLDSVAHNIHFYALDIHDGYTSSGDLDLSSNCDIDLEFQAAVDFQMDLLHLGLESPYLVPTTNDVWLSDSEADLGEDEELYDFSGMPSLEDRSQQSTSEESIDECAPSHDALEPSFQCDWSPDKHASQKIVGSSLGMTLSPDSTGFHEIDVGTLGASPGLSTYLGPTRGEDYVEEHLFCDSPFGRLVGSELVNDHGTTSFEDEHASLPMLSGNEELEIRFTASCTNNRQVKKYFEENLEHLAPLSDSSNTSMECDLRLEASHSVLRTNVDVPNFLIMDFD